MPARRRLRREALTRVDVERALLAMRADVVRHGGQGSRRGGAVGSACGSVGLQLYTIRAECDRDLEGDAAQRRRAGLRRCRALPVARARAPAGRAGGSTRPVSWPPAATRGSTRSRPSCSSSPTSSAVLGTDRVAISWIDPAWLDGARAGPRPDRGRGARSPRRRAPARLPQPRERGRAARRRRDVPRPAPAARPADLLWLELDLGWVWQAGGDPVAELEATTGRCPLVHVKDFSSRERPATTFRSATESSATSACCPPRCAPASNGSIVEQDDVEGRALR